jgi:hypothetical protein
MPKPRIRITQACSYKAESVGQWREKQDEARRRDLTYGTIPASNLRNWEPEKGEAGGGGGTVQGAEKYTS